MNIITLDLPIAIFVAIFLVWVLFRKGKSAFVLSSHSAATFGAQFSYIVNFSVPKVVPILVAPFGLRRGNSGLVPFFPFLVYVTCVTLVGSAVWDIPTGVNFAYGAGRAYIQLFHFIVWALVARATALAFQREGAVRIFWVFFSYVVLLHGIASLYQLIAASVGFPLIGISRPFGLSATGLGDFAAFGTASGATIIRPGGLAGEPKGMAVIFGIYIAGYLFGGRRIYTSKRQRRMFLIGFALAVLGWLAAFSTSAIIAAVLIFPCCIFFWGARGLKRATAYAFVLAPVAIFLWMSLTNTSLSNIEDIFAQRTVDRLEPGRLDLPVEASIDAIIRQPIITVFGAGLGGSSFLIMEYMGRTFEYAYVPNIGIIHLLVELGLIGTVLLLVPLGVLTAKGALMSHRSGNSSAAMLSAVSLSAAGFSLTGSTLPFAYPLALAAAVTAIRICRLEAESEKP